MSSKSRPNGVSNVDVLIAGGGAVGAALALAVHRDSGGALKIAIADPRPVWAAAAGRAYAIASGGRAFLARLGLWDRLTSAAQPINAMRITDSRLQDAVRPTRLTFEAQDEPLAHIVDEAELVAALQDAVAQAGLQRFAASVVGLTPEIASVGVALTAGDVVRAKLVAAADGARSPCRSLAEIPIVSWDYGQTGLVAVVAHERDHGGVAVQHFLPGGPFAILPMTGRRSSIVWTDADETAKTMLTRHRDDVAAELDRRFGAFLGEIELVSPLASFPIRFLMARRLVGERIALVGDAAHVIHPLAGQGLNLGLEDAEALAARTIAAARLGLDAGDPAALAAYERDRRSAAVGMGIATDLLNRLFSTDAAAARLARDFGLGLVDRMPELKDFFARRAAGHSAVV